ncbi:MAG: ABC transporter ATP-binding protein [Nocardioidaceae bacterium]
MRRLPLDHPGTADHRSPSRFLWWLAKGQSRTLAAGMAFGCIWMVSQAIMPAIIGRAIDDGVAAKDTEALLWLASVFLAVGLIQALSGIMRHRYAVVNWLTAAYRTVQLVTRQSTRLGGTLPRRVDTGEVIAIGTSDLSHIGNLMDVTARTAGSVASVIVVTVILLRTSVTLGLIVLLGVPAVLLLTSPLLTPLERRQRQQREQTGQLATVATDIVTGLRVLRGIGGEQRFHARYVRASQRVRSAGVRVARLQSVLDSAEVLLPGIFVVVVVWVSARFAVQGQISPGQMVALYGYAVFLLLPLRTTIEFANKYIRAIVSARRIIRVLELQPDDLTTDPLPGPAPGCELVDVASGLVVAPGLLTALVSEQPESTALIADRLGRHAPGEVRWGGVPLDRIDRDELRRRVLVSDTNAALFSGPLREAVDVRGRGEEALASALHAAAAADVLDVLPGRLDGMLTERGRALSGGQRQRLVLARALDLDPEVLVLVEPTSAVDAHTEARIADRLYAARAGRTTVVTTSSPLLLDRADQVALVVDGRVVNSGSHHDLLRSDPAYRAVVTREMSEPEEAR